MTEQTITSASAGNNQLRRLYETAFPVEEQIPWNDMHLVDAMPLDFTAYSRNGSLLGFTIVYPRPSFNWFWYFAVPEQLRGQGIGQQILSRLIERYKDYTNILDMESPEQECPIVSNVAVATRFTCATVSAIPEWDARSRASTTPS